MDACRLLVIEDDRDIAALVTRVASEAGFAARATQKFCDTLTLYDQFLPHIIILDILMPDMDGMEVLSFLHKRASPSRIVILSGRADYRPMAATLGQGFGLHIAATLAKPFRVADLRATLENIRTSLAPAQTALA